MDVFKSLRKSPDKYIRNRLKPVADWRKRDGPRVDDHLQCRICCEGALHQMWLILILRANVRLDGFLGSSHNRVVTVVERQFSDGGFLGFLGFFGSLRCRSRLPIDELLSIKSVVPVIRNASTTHTDLTGLAGHSSAQHNQ